MKNIKRPNKKLYENMSKRMTSSEETLNKIISDAIDWGPLRVERIVEGVGNEVYRLIASNKQNPDLILRIHHGNHPEFYTEKWAFDEVKARGVAVPNIIKITDFKNDEDTFTYSLETSLDGETLDKLLSDGLDMADRERFSILAGETLAHIHQVKTMGYGNFSRTGVGKFRSLAESMQQHDDYNELSAASSTTKLNDKELKNAIDMIDKIDSEEKSHLIHTDYAPKHIFIHRGKISGIIDFEICMSGLAATDFNRWRVQESRISMKDLITGYERVSPLPADFWNILFIVQIHSALRTMLYHYRVTKNNTELNKAANEVKLLVSSQKPLLN